MKFRKKGFKLLYTFALLTSQPPKGVASAHIILIIPEGIVGGVLPAAGREAFRELEGYNADCTASNQVRIGNSAVSSIGGYANWSNISDARFKTDITENITGLDFIKSLRPVSYNLDLTKIDDFFDQHYNERDSSGMLLTSAKNQVRYSGFIAQEVEAAAKQVGTISVG